MFKFKDIVESILKESLSKFVYHFTNLERFYSMVDTDTIKLTKASNDRDVFLNDSFGNGKLYFLSTTRVRDGRFGYSNGLNTRIELNTEVFNNKFKSSPVSFFKGETGTESSKNYYSKKRKYTPIAGYQWQKRTENEDRIFSNMPELHNINKYINRVDVLIELNDWSIPNFKEIYPDKYKKLRDLYNSSIGLKLFVYNDMNEFNKQGKNITEEILKEL